MAFLLNEDMQIIEINYKSREWLDKTDLTVRYSNSTIHDWYRKNVPWKVKNAIRSIAIKNNPALTVLYCAPWKAEKWKMKSFLFQNMRERIIWNFMHIL